MRAAIASLEAETDPRAGWNEVMRGSLLLRLRQLVDVRQDMRDLRRHIEAGGGAARHAARHPHRGPECAAPRSRPGAVVGVAAALTILVLCAFWIDTGWQAGGGAAALGRWPAACSPRSTIRPRR